MTTETLPVHQPVAPQPVTEQQANAWIGLATEKNRLTFELGRMELAAQGILLRAQQPGAGYEVIDGALAEYRKSFTGLQELRKGFTNQIDAGIIQPLMAFEKRVDPKTNATYNELASRSLQLRKEEANKAAIANAKNMEIATFKAHVVNEFTRVVAEWRTIIRREFTGHYENCLKEKIADPGVPQVKEMLRTIPPPNVAKFRATYLSNEEMLNLYNEIHKPDYESYYNDLMKEVDDLFSNYESDMANTEAAIKHRQQEAALTEIEEANTAKEEQALNTLIATSETVVIDEPKIKKSVHVVVIESEVWAVTVMAAFTLHRAKLSKYIRVKSWSKLNIGQMATYLGQYATDEGLTFPGLELKELEK